jgi:glucan biosynthesis protein C
VGQGSRVFYLDAVRAFAMIFGIVSHGTTIANAYIEQMPLFFGIQVFNDLFRAATFFLVSGYFSALVYKKRGLREYARGRAEVVLIPLLMAQFFVVPWTNWLVHTWHNGPMGLWEYLQGGFDRPTRGTDWWGLHLWFLYSLAIFALLAPLLASVVNSRRFNRLLDWYLDRTAGWTIWANVLIFAVGIVIGRALYDQVFRHVAPEGTPFAWIARATCFHLPMFFLGMIAFSNKRFLDSVSKLSIPGLLVFGTLYYLEFRYGLPLERNLERVVYWLIRGGMSVFTISAIIWFFKTFVNRPSKFLSFAVDSAYSFYLFHFTFIYLVAWATRAFTDNLYISYAFVILVALPLTFAWHAFVIDRVPVLRYLFTGKRTKRI